MQKCGFARRKARSEPGHAWEKPGGKNQGLTSGRKVPVWITNLAFLAANLGAPEVIGMAASGAKYGIGHNSSGPQYSGTKHTRSHGGHFPGGQGSSHKGGRYGNPRTSDQYGRHKK
ncbi:MAG TPA: hypothetical protein VK335_00700 [Bryobacteraceae bacterium]|nr:hypothetical protein [Bryobacteraceae bacterium]HZW92021.1 hypothetical protein [Candidatus Eremiobacteraceae bacterium]